MNNDSSFTADVLVAGAGPVGLLLACELALAGIRVLVLEREVDPASALKAPPLGARGVSIASAEALDRRGLLDALLAAGAGASRKAQAGHFAGIPIDASLIDPTGWPWRLPGALATNIAADMHAVEAVLAARAAALGVEIRRGRAVDTVHDDGAGVTVRPAARTSRRAGWSAPMAAAAACAASPASTSPAQSRNSRLTSRWWTSPIRTSSRLAAT